MGDPMPYGARSGHQGARSPMCSDGGGEAAAAESEAMETVGRGDGQAVGVGGLVSPLPGMNL